MHHLDGTAGEAECHPHQRAGPGPVDQIIRRSLEEALIGPILPKRQKIRIAAVLRLPSTGPRDFRICKVERMLDGDRRYVRTAVRDETFGAS